MSAEELPKRLKLREIANAIGRTPRQVQEYLTRGMPRHGDGTYDLKTVQEWVAANIKQPLRESDVSGPFGASCPTDRPYWEAKKVEEQARREGLKRLEMEGELVRRDDIRRENAAIAVRLRTRLLALDGRIAAIVPAEMKATTKRMVAEAVHLSLKEALEAPVMDTTLEQMILDEADRIRAERTGT